MATLTHDLAEAEKKFGVSKEKLFEFLVAKGFDEGDIGPEGKLTEEMFSTMEAELGIFGELEGPIEIGRVELTGPSLGGIRRAIDEAKDKKSHILDLRNLGLSEIPSSALALKEHVTEILLGPRLLLNYPRMPGHEISNLKVLGVFSRLKKLVIRAEGIKSISQIPILPELEILELTSCGLFDLRGILNFRRLKHLNLNRNRLTKVDELLDLEELESLQLSYNRIADLGFFYKWQPKLRTLKLAFNGERIGDEIGNISRIKTLESLDLSGNELGSIFPLSKLTGLKELYVSKNGIYDISPLRLLPSLQTVDLSWNGVEDISSLAKLKTLKTLLLKDNRINAINALSRLVSLEKLDVGKNKIESCKYLSGLSRLEWLSLSRNELMDITPLAKLTSLSYLDLSLCGITDIGALHGLQDLKLLNLNGNKVKDILPLRSLLQKKKPSFRVALDGRPPFALNPTGLLLANNPIANPPIQYLSNGSKAILSYWDQQEKKKVKAERKQIVNEAKLIIVGNSHVGKSTLSYLLRTGKLPPDSLASTHGLEFSTWIPDWKVNRRQLSINIIDFGGQEYYHDTHHLFFNDKAAYLLLWEPDTDVNKRMEAPVGDQKQTAPIRYFSVEYWLNAIEIYAGRKLMYITEIKRSRDPGVTIEEIAEEDAREDVVEADKESGPMVDMTVTRFILPPVLLVQTHADKRGRRFLNLKDLQDKYNALHGSASISMNVESANSAGIDLLKLSIRELYESLSDNFGQKYLESWVTIRNYIEEHEKGKYYIMTTAAFRKYFHAHSNSREDYTIEDIRTLCITLDYWGVVLYRYAIEDLRDTIIVNPQSFIEKVNAVLTEKIRQKNGVITQQEVIEILEKDTAKAGAFLKILTTFKVLFELPQKDAAEMPLYISPMYLAEKPDHIKIFTSNFVAWYKIRYEGYFHKGILLDCFKELGKDLYSDQGQFFYWQWGMVLKKGQRIICIEFDEENLDQILIKTIRVDGERLGSNKFLQEVLATFDKINIPYKCKLKLSIDGVHFVAKGRLLKEMESGINKFESEEGRNFDVRDFFFLLQDAEIALPHKRVFVSYSSKDRDHLDRLAAHLELYKKAGIIGFWDDLMLRDRNGWDEQIRDEMNSANILIMLLSPDYLATDYILKEEIRIALDHLKTVGRSKRVFWVLLRPCNYQVYQEIAQYPIYPLKEKEDPSGKARQKAISEHDDQDREWVELLKMILDERE
jgi:internalin A